MNIKPVLIKLNRLKIISFLLIGLFLVVNLITLPKYGISWDEPYSHNIAKASIDYIKLGDVNILEFNNDFKYYGPAFAILNNYFAKVAANLFELNYIDSHHILIIIIASLGLLILFLFVRKLFNEKIALFSLVFFIFFPRFIGHAHYNPKDIPIMVSALAVLFFLYLAFLKKNYLWAIVAGILMGISLSIRVDALLILPIFFVSYIGYLIFELKIFKQKKLFQYLKKDFIILVVSLCFTAITTFLTWPSLWQDSLLFFHSVSYFINHSWPGFVLYFGQIYKGSNLPWHYAPLYLLITTPLITLIFFLVGFYIILKKIVKERKILSYGLILSWFFLPLLIEMKPGIVKYDGIRHFLIVIPSLVIIAGLGLWHILTKIRNLSERDSWIRPKFYPLANLRNKILTFVLFVIILFSLFTEASKAHPYEGSYFNEPLRFFIPNNIENYFDIEYWGVTYREGINWLNKNSEANAKICVPLADHLIKAYEIRDDLSFDCDEGYNYYMFFNRNSALPKEKIREISLNYEPVFKIERYNSNLLYIYKIN